MSVGSEQLAPFPRNLLVPERGIRRVEISMPEFRVPDPTWLEVAPFHPRFYFQFRSSPQALVACGIVSQGPASSLSQLLQDSDPGVRVLGGARFHPNMPAGSEWEEFAEEHFFIPRLEISQTSSGTVLAVNLLEGESFEPAAREWLAGIDRLVEGESAFSASARWDRPNFEEWSGEVARALEGFQTGSLEKVVLARHSCFELSSQVRSYQLLRILSRRTPGCFHFAFEPTADSGVFLGASPELLFQREERELVSEAVAGTRPRSLDPAEDGRMETQLLFQGKERHEHQVVVAELDRIFSRVCSRHSYAAEPTILKLPNVQHLRTAFSGILAPGISDEHLLNSLHPTPATCGYPIGAAQDFLIQNENFDRGWYAGPLGVFSLDHAEFTVAIRSMRARGKLLDVYAGAGIVEQSDPEKEWAELESKISEILHILSP